MNSKPQTAAIRQSIQTEQQAKDAKDELVRELVHVVSAFVAMIEDSMAGATHPKIGPFVPGVTDLELKPDGSVKLSDARTALRKAALAKARGI